MSENRQAPPVDERQAKEREAVARETAAMGVAFNMLQPLGEESRYRAVRWLAMALDLPLSYSRPPRREEEVPF